MEQMIIIQGMLDRAKCDDYNLDMEVIVAMVNILTNNKLTLIELQLACDAALCEWDL